ncbi:MAG: HEAT repeat domain-containing protein [Deltaproteobacteria bacterium]|nr:HEAT repeat domain-containing protein [Deltaproteobacteria bacterium]
MKYIILIIVTVTCSLPACKKETEHAEKTQKNKKIKKRSTSKFQKNGKLIKNSKIQTDIKNAPKEDFSKMTTDELFEILKSSRVTDLKKIYSELLKRKDGIIEKAMSRTQSANNFERLNAVKLLGHANLKSPKIASHLAKLMLKEQRFQIRVMIVDSIALNGLYDASTVNAFKTGLSDSVPLVKWQTVKSIGTFGTKAIEFKNLIIPLLKDEKYWMRHASALSLWKISPGEKIGATALAQESGAKGRKEMMALVKALGQIKNHPEIVVPALVKLLNSKNKSIARTAAISLGNLGKGASGAIKSLEAATKSKDYSISKHASDAIKKIKESQ